jgi:nicotinamidase-related amidase
MSSSIRETASKPRHLVCLDLLRWPGAISDDTSRTSAANGVHNCRRILTYARGMNWTVTHVFDHSARSRRARAIGGLEPLQIEPVLYRTGVSAFSNRIFRESVEESLEAELIILSLSLSPTCLATALAARDRGVAVALVEDALSGSAGAAAGIDAIQTLSHSIAAPFVKILHTDDLVDIRRGLRVVS